jgi:hypothetical protein
MEFASGLSVIEPTYTFSRFLQQNAASGIAEAWANNPAFPTDPDTAAWTVEVVNAILKEHKLQRTRRHILVRLTDPCGHTLQWTTGLGGRAALVGEIFDALSEHHSKIADCLQGHLKASEACYQLRIERMKRRFVEEQWGEFRLGIWEQLGCFISMELVKESALPKDLRQKASARFELPAPCMIVPDPQLEERFGPGRPRHHSRTEEDARGPVDVFLDIFGLERELVVA